ncbi:hypothetical protein [Paenibacillus sp. DMB5]|uniref:hypothetical protein n=1 Tax=Paenibacillus sp. DMB5 TaxID=1780103 RepID=UPI00076CDC1C|nr:hypothetical protein [Paenibacillus sp. DMB5]KUP22047.1 hypothetical protein AWJ19_21290 [Paenibacillus sp. DMB5]
MNIDWFKPAVGTQVDTSFRVIEISSAMSEQHKEIGYHNIPYSDEFMCSFLGWPGTWIVKKVDVRNAPYGIISQKYFSYIYDLEKVMTKLNLPDFLEDSLYFLEDTELELETFGVTVLEVNHRLRKNEIIALTTLCENYWSGFADGVFIYSSTEPTQWARFEMIDFIDDEFIFDERWSTCFTKKDC